MKCGRLKLQERMKDRSHRPVTSEKPRRYCQKRLVDPQHDEDPRWIDVLERFHCNDSENCDYNDVYNNSTTQDGENLFLSVQNLKFQGDEKQSKRPRTGFKYKTFTDGNKHRMFVKQAVPNVDQTEEDRSSQLTCYYYDDYAKYLSNAERSRPSSAKSSIFLHGTSANFKENKAVQVDFSNTSDSIKARKPIYKPKPRPSESDSKKKLIEEIITSLPETETEDTKVTFEKTGKRKSLTISRTQSPETVQVIRVDVVCNYSSTPPLSDYEDKKHAEVNSVDKLDKNTETLSSKRSQFANKYLLTNTIKTLDENLSGGAKVTLLCKTFRLTDRSKITPGKKSTNVNVTSIHAGRK